jgi:hypothetical protein
MATYEITFRVTEECAIEIEADNEEKVHELFRDNAHDWWKKSRSKYWGMEIEDIQDIREREGSK